MTLQRLKPVGFLGPKPIMIKNSELIYKKQLDQWKRPEEFRISRFGRKKIPPSQRPILINQEAWEAIKKISNKY